MRYSTRILLASTMAASLVAAAFPQPALAAFDSTELKCRSTIAKSGGKYAKTVQKAITGCHKERDKNGPNSQDCNDLASADLKEKVPTAATKLQTKVASKCTTGTPGDILYQDCPAPCSAAVPTISSFTHVTDCLVCLTNANEEAMSETAYGDPTAPIADDAEASCHKSITKNGSKLFNSVIKTVAKCQANFEKNGSETVSPSCVSNPGFGALTQTAYNKAQVSIADACDGVTLPSATLDPCGNEATVFDLSLCVVESARNAAQVLVTQYLELDDGGSTTTTQPTTTTTSDNTTTTLPGAGDPACPDLGELVLYSKMSNEPCTTNGDCTFPRYCNTALPNPRCETTADLDSGWNGAGHDADINDGVKAMANLLCPGPASPGCGECAVTGLSPEADNCRCANNIATICDEPFAADANDCGGAVCNCYFGAPFPLSAQGTPVCVSNRFSEDIFGTANPDLGAGEITANLRTQVFLGYTRDMPCPVCGGKCSNDNSGCIFDEDCDGGATCVQDTAGDGIRNGLCIRNPDTHVSDGVACEVSATNASFPARIGNATPGLGGAGYSIDCQPDVGKNVSGAGLKISLSQTTGLSSLGFGVDCDGSGVGTDLCPCLVCSIDTSTPCDGNAVCGELQAFCDAAPNDGGIACATNAECNPANIGPCSGLGVCRKKQSQMCTSNADCLNQNAGACAPQTCTAKGSNGTTPQPNFCADDICTDQGGGEGTCLAGPNLLFCDGLVKANGGGASGCLSNSDCVGGYGVCTVTEQANCFLDPIVAIGVPDPEFPIAGATFCIPPTSNPGVNSSAGLPGPGRVLSQGAAKTYCASNHAVEYNPGGLPACP
jgi:hypothetical protein